MKRWISACMALAMIAAGTDSLYIETKADSEEVRILFTHDLRDHIEEVKSLDEENAVVYSGGYEYLATALDEYRTEQTVLLDAGNFSASTMYASLNSTKAPDLTLMSRMGYDAVGVGLVDFTYGAGMFGEMLSAAQSHPSLLLSNFTSGSGNAAFEEGWSAAEGSAYTLIESGGYQIGVFALCEPDEAFGEGAPIVITDPLAAAAEAAEALKQQGADYIICLYSTDEDDFEELCNAASIDLIIAGGNHTATEKYRKQGNTLIVSSDPYGTSFGVLDIDPSSKNVKNYEIVPVSSSLYEASWGISETMYAYQSEISDTVMRRFSLNQNPVFRAGYSLTTYGRTQSGKAYAEAADLLTDSMIEAYDAPDSDEAKAVSIITEDMATGTILQGNVSANDLFSMAYKGMGTDGIPGYNLVHVYMRGSDLLTLCEMDLILHDDNSPEKFHFGRMYYEYSMNRPVTNRVIDVFTEEADGYYIASTDDRLYPVITTTDILQSIPQMIIDSGVSGECNIYDETGRPVTDFDVMTIRSGDGAAIKLWSAISSYAAHFERGRDGIDDLPETYKKARKQRTKISSLNVIKLLKHANRATFDFYAKAVAIPVAVLVGLNVLVWLINLKKKKETNA